MESLELAKKLTAIIDDKLGEDIICIDLRGISSVTDFLIIATGKADTHVKSISNALLEEMKKIGIAPLAHEGLTTGTWACLDYGDAIIHIMRKKEREIYNLRSIWGAAPLI